MSAATLREQLLRGYGADLAQRRTAPAALRRVRVLQAPSEKRRGLLQGYVGAKNTRLTQDQPTSPISIDQVVAQDLETLVARSRHVIQNNSHGRRFARLVRINVVGEKGPTFRSTVEGPDGEPDLLARAAIERAWKDWCGLGNCDSTGTLSFVGIQRLAARTIPQDGELFYRRITGPAAGKYGFRLQLLDSQLVPVRLFRVTADGGYVRFGIEFDKWERPVAYHLAEPRDPRAAFPIGYAYSQQTKRVAAGEIGHVFLAEDVGQKRGIPWTATALFDLAQQGAFDDAALTAARIGASKVGAIKEAEGQAYTGDDIQKDDENDEELEGPRIMQIEPGVFDRLRHGETIEAFDPDYPHETYKPFTETVTRRTAAGLGPGYSSLSGDYTGTSYSSARMEQVKEEDVWVEIQEFFITHLLRPVFLDWLEWALIMGAIRLAPGGPRLSVTDLERLKEHEWSGRRWARVDPLKDVQAKDKAIALNITTVSACIRAEGGDPDTIFRERAEELRKFKELGITPAAKPTPFSLTAAPAGAASTEDDDEEDGE